MFEDFQFVEWIRPVIVTDLVLCFLGALLVILIPSLTVWAAKIALRLMIFSFVGAILLAFIYIWMATQ